MKGGKSYWQEGLEEGGQVVVFLGHTLRRPARERGMGRQRGTNLEGLKSLEGGSYMAGHSQNSCFGDRRHSSHACVSCEKEGWDNFQFSLRRYGKREAGEFFSRPFRM